ncbi:beta-1,4-glucuronyltransferase 1-like [Mizuhopecten yessoensis]|uniref:Beta-1,4-glucuronyltransferase 1 n=1 Tax=Mizuhopecten yessoensis TaxID=6573 RepID=A0A210PQ54_MIZYE|nr:beta-1,4-glucuronyltransferase 1-like [Mizuhopecten yessoensis]OWF38630.1 N-acetyllactosaminide beta-1,3-N-acetylglucosaminyltransferase [Mizuhopecten yessoensis]
MVLGMCIRKLGLGRIIVFLVIAIIFLQIVHFYSLTNMSSREKELEGKQQSHKTTQKFSSTARKVIQRLHHSHLMDSSGSYYLVRNVLIPDGEDTMSDHSSDVTLVTQCSANHLDDLVDLAERWNGAVSISVFTYDNDFPFAIKAMLYSHKCFNQIRRHVSINMIYPINKPPRVSDIDNISFEAINCDVPFHELRTTNTDNYAVSGIEYPHNVLRNFALKGAKTPYVFVVDIDMIPSSNLLLEFKTFIERRKQSSDGRIPKHDKVAFVVPSFEIKESIRIPETKTMLLTQMKSNNVRPFYMEACQRCQKQTSYSVWEKLVDIDFLDVGYTVDWKDPWEPFFITESHLPLYDERFKQYGFNRISQVCEMHIAGYRFDILNKAFLVHKGFKFAGKFHKSKEEELGRNRMLFRNFKEELKSKYPNSSRRCY